MWSNCYYVSLVTASNCDSVSTLVEPAAYGVVVLTVTSTNLQVLNPNVTFHIWAPTEVRRAESYNFTIIIMIRIRIIMLMEK